MTGAKGENKMMKMVEAAAAGGDGQGEGARASAARHDTHQPQ
jgi:hypothetical protein